MSWKEQFDKRFCGFSGLDKMFSYTDPEETLDEEVKGFISTEIIEKLIEDIPDIDLVSTVDETAKVNLKQQLRDKWLL